MVSRVYRKVRGEKRAVLWTRPAPPLVLLAYWVIVLLIFITSFVILFGGERLTDRERENTRVRENRNKRLQPITS